VRNMRIVDASVATSLLRDHTLELTAPIETEPRFGLERPEPPGAITNAPVPAIGDTACARFGDMPSGARGEPCWDVLSRGVHARTGCTVESRRSVKRIVRVP